MEYSNKGNETDTRSYIGRILRVGKNLGLAGLVAGSTIGVSGCENVIDYLKRGKTGPDFYDHNGDGGSDSNGDSGNGGTGGSEGNDGDSGNGGGDGNGGNTGAKLENYFVIDLMYMFAAAR